MPSASSLFKKPRYLWSGLLFLILLSLTFTAITRDLDLDLLRQVIPRLNPWYFFSGLLVMLAFFGCQALNYRCLLMSLGQPASFLSCLKYSFIDFYFSGVTPATMAGQPAQLVYMAKDGINLGASSLTLLLFNMSYHLGILLLTLAAFLFRGFRLFAGIGLLKYTAFLGIVVHVFLMLLFLTAIFQADWLEKPAAHLIPLLARFKLIKNPAKTKEHLRQQLEEYRQGAQYIKEHPGMLLQLLFLTVCHLVFFLVVPYFAYRAFGFTGSSPLEIMVAQLLLTLTVESLPLPGGLGVAEAGFLLLYGPIFGLLLTPALLVCRGLNYYLPLLAGAGVAGITSLRSNIKNIVHIN